MSAPADAARTCAVRVRPARSSDLDALVALEHACFAGKGASRRALRHAIGSPTMSLLIAVTELPEGREWDEILVGAATMELRCRTGSARLSLIAVSPARVGQGLGGMLLEAAEKEALANGCRRVRLETRPENGAAIRLYERRGYSRYAAKPGYYEDGAMAWCYEKALDPS